MDDMQTRETSPNSSSFEELHHIGSSGDYRHPGFYGYISIIIGRLRMAREIARLSAFLISATLCVAVAQPAAAWQPSPSECDYYARNEAQRAGSALGGAAKGAIGGAIFGAIVGKGRGAKTGAALGGILGGLGRAAQNENIRRRAYDDCMAGHAYR